MPMLQEVLHRNQTFLTDEEKKVKAARKVAAALKSKATREKNKEKAISDRVAALLTQSSVVSPPIITSSMTQRPLDPIPLIVSPIVTTSTPLSTVTPSAAAPKATSRTSKRTATPTITATTTLSSVPTVCPVIDHEKFLSQINSNDYT